MGNFKYSILLYFRTDLGSYECEGLFYHDAKLNAGDILYTDDFNEIVISSVAWRMDRGNEAFVSVEEFYTRSVGDDEVQGLSPDPFHTIRGPWISKLKETPCDQS
jgi:hypothetical protein